MPGRHRLKIAIVALLTASCTGASGYVSGAGIGANEVNLPSSRDTGTYTFFIDQYPDLVWFELRNTLLEMQIPLQRERMEEEEDRRQVPRSLATGRFRIDPGLVHCGARPSGEQPVARSVDGVLRAHLEEIGAARTRVTFRLDAQSSSIEPPAFSGVRTACVSRGVLERRIAERTQNRLS
jgi:hypothetical protein